MEKAYSRLSAPCLAWKIHCEMCPRPRPFVERIHQGVQSQSFHCFKVLTFGKTWLKRLGSAMDALWADRLVALQGPRPSVSFTH